MGRRSWNTVKSQHRSKEDGKPQRACHFGRGRSAHCKSTLHGAGGGIASDAGMQRRIDTWPVGTRGDCDGGMVVSGLKSASTNARICEPNGGTIGKIIKT